MSHRWKDEFVLITGASSGLGKSIAIESARLKMPSILIARNLSRLNTVAGEVEKNGGKTFVFQHDLKDVDTIPSLYEKIIKETSKDPTILINNAGYNAAGFVQNTPVKVYNDNYKVNTLAPISLIQCALPAMIHNNHGYIVNIMSAAMYHSFPGISSYCSSKFALNAIHESLKTELSGLDVKTLYVNPGGFKSNYWKNMDVDDRLKDYKHPARKTDPDPDSVAAKILEAIAKRKEKIDLSGYMDKIGFHLNYWFPSLVDRLLSKRNQSLIKKRPI